jgi:hypothetical protein
MKIITVLILFSSLTIGCVQQSRITSSWTSAEKNKTYHSVVVFALTHDIDAKKLVEGDLASALEKKNVSVITSLDAFPPSFTKDTPKEEMLAKVQKAGADAIITVTLLNKQTEAHYVPGYPNYAPGFWGYYSFWYPTVYTPGYYTQDRVYYIETNVYDVNNDALVWSARSETYNPASLTGFSQELAGILANKLRRDNIIAPTVEMQHHDKKITSKR